MVCGVSRSIVDYLHPEAAGGLDDQDDLARSCTDGITSPTSCASEIFWCQELRASLSGAHVVGAREDTRKEE